MKYILPLILFSISLSLSAQTEVDHEFVVLDTCLSGECFETYLFLNEDEILGSFHSDKYPAPSPVYGNYPDKNKFVFYENDNVWKGLKSDDQLTGIRKMKNDSGYVFEFSLNAPDSIHSFEYKSQRNAKMGLGMKTIWFEQKNLEFLNDVIARYFTNKSITPNHPKNIFTALQSKMYGDNLVNARAEETFSSFSCVPVCLDDKFITLQFGELETVDNALVISDFYYLSFQLDNKSLMNTSNLFKQDSWDKLSYLLEKKLANQQQLNLNEFRSFAAQENWTTAANIGLTKTGVFFNYGAFDVISFEKNQVTVFVPYVELKDYLTTEFIENFTPTL